MRFSLISIVSSFALTLCAFNIQGCKSSSSTAAAAVTAAPTATPSPTPTPSATPTGLTAAALENGGYNGDGDFQAACQPISGNTMGTALNGYSVWKIVNFSAGGTYSLETMFYDSGNCQGTEGLVYIQGGTFTVGSLDTTLS